MVRRLYFDDPTLVTFEARVVSTTPVPGGEPGGLEVELDETAFYPEGGGQPADRGTLGGAPVLDVQEHDGRIVHRVRGAHPDAFAVGARVAGDVDRARRTDHTQQHSGQHLLTRAFLNLLRAKTTSFHLGAAAATIDLDRGGVSDDDVARVEDEAARVIRDDRPVLARIVRGADDLAAIGGDLRKDPTITGDFRVVSISDYDHCPCGGTHVLRTGEIEAIRVRRVERLKPDLCRVEFVCGERARSDARAKTRLARELVRLLSVEEADLAGAVDKLIARTKDAEKRREKLAKQLVPVRAAELLAAAEVAGSTRVLVATLDAAERGELQPLAQELGRQQDVVAVLVVLAASGEKAQVAVAAGERAQAEANALLTELLAPLGGKGGGSPRVAQGGCDGARGAELLAAAAALVRAHAAGRPDRSAS